MILVFDTEQTAIDCETQISTIMRSLYANAGYNIINNEVEIKTGKQHIKKWAIPQKAYNLDKWYFQSPQNKWPDDYDSLVSGHIFQILETIPAEWIQTS